MFNQTNLLAALILSMHLTSCSSWLENPIIAKTTVVNGRELDTLRALFTIHNKSCKPSIKVLKAANTSKYDSTSSIDTNVNILQIIMSQENDVLTTNLFLSNSLGWYTYAGEISDTVLCEQSQDYWFLGWFNEPFFKNEIGGENNKHHRYELHIKAINKSTGREILNDILYTTTCCLDQLDIKYNEYTRSLLYAFNDFGGKDIKLMYGFIQIDETNNLLVRKPFPVFKDETDKRRPIFIDNGSNVFLYHTTGDSWGIGGHIGKQQIALFKIDALNRLAKYNIIIDEYDVDEKIIMIKDTVYYRLKDSNAFEEMTIKKIAWNDLVEYKMK